MSAHFRRGDVALAPEHRAPTQVGASLERLSAWLRDQGWTVGVQGTALHASRHPGLFRGAVYGNLSPFARLGRGTLACWADGDRMYLRFRPAWAMVFLDAVLLGLGFAVRRGIAAGSRWEDAVFTSLMFAVLLAAFMPLMRWRFVVTLERAVWSSRYAWDDLRARGRNWRLAWSAAGLIALNYWVLDKWIVPFLFRYAGLSMRLAIQVHQHQTWNAVVLVLLSMCAAALLLAMTRLGFDKERY
jgi:hypothetical protein